MSHLSQRTKMRRSFALAAVTGLAFVQLSCSKTHSDLSISFPSNSANIVPATQFSCADIRTATSGAAPTASVATDSFSIPDMVFTWKGTDTLTVTSILLYASSPYLNGGSYSTSMNTELPLYFYSASAAAGTSPPFVPSIGPDLDTGGTATTVHLRTGQIGSAGTSFSAADFCSFNAGGFSRLASAPTSFTFPLTVEVIGVAVNATTLVQRTIDTQTTINLTYQQYGPTPTPTPAPGN